MSDVIHGVIRLELKIVDLLLGTYPLRRYGEDIEEISQL
jgi:hypothetical protein